ncbi:uncharacterized protein LOC126899404 [Daktulosphaira vitifoliae]|uniref:uncharacterized protein LOC126899404 n=1 Tax=Daktulosphaira vitifoliae TaxID=58002 RepID=UPI0021A9C93D|nr:uncharacterized protein LOC126899404 [Daktulosphaira vitifoliae]
MIIKIYYLNFFLFTIIKCNTINYKDTYESNYMEYLFEIVDFVRFQDENTSIQHLTNDLKINSNYILDLGLKLNSKNFPIIFNAIIELLKYRYGIVIETFYNNTVLILQCCDSYYSKKRFEHFVDCYIILNDTIVSSKNLFENLNNVMEFFSSLNISYKIKHYDITANVMDNLSTIVKYINSKRELDIHDYIDHNANPLTEKAYNGFVSVNQFYKELSLKISKISTKNNLDNTWQDKLEKDDSIENKIYSISQEDYIQNICNKLKVFYNEALQLEYINLGFHNLLHPTTPGLIPPTHKDSSNDLGMYVIITLFNERYWQSLIHTRIRVNNQTKDVHEIRHVEVNEINFFNIKQDVAHMLKCRFSALLQNVFASLSAMQHLIKIENAHKSYNTLIACVNSFKSTIPSVITVLNSLLATLALLKKATIWDYKGTSPSCLKSVSKIAYAYYNALKTQNISPVAETNEFEAIQYFISIQNTRYSLVRLFSDTKMNQFLENYCDYDRPILTNFELIKSLRNNQNNDTDQNYSGFICLKISSHLKQICKEFITTDYDLGFRKLVNQYII